MPSLVSKFAKHNQTTLLYLELSLYPWKRSCLLMGKEELSPLQDQELSSHGHLELSPMGFCFGCVATANLIRKFSFRSFYFRWK